MRRLQLAALVAAMLLAACEQAPTAPDLSFAAAPAATVSGQVERAVYEGTFGLEGWVLHPWCEENRDNEFVAMQGEVYERIVMTELPNGRLSGRMTARPIGVYGVGTESGAVYQAVLFESLSVQADETGSRGSARSRMRLRNTATGDTFDVLVVTRFETGEGGFEVVHEKELLRCATR